MPLRVVLLVAVFSLGFTLALARRYSWRFSLRTLLIAMTLVAVALGLIFAPS